MKGWIDQDPAFASPQFSLSIVAKRLGLLIEPSPLRKRSVREVDKSTSRNLWYQTGADFVSCDASFIRPGRSVVLLASSTQGQSVE